MNKATFERITDRNPSDELRQEGVGLYNMSTGMEYVVYDTPFGRYVEAWHAWSGDDTYWYLSQHSMEDVQATLIDGSEQ